MLVVAGLALIAVAIAGALLASRPGEEGGAAAKAPATNGVAAIEPDSGQLTKLVRTARTPSNVAVGERAVWFLESDARTVTRMDPKTKTITDTIPSPGVATDLAVGGGALWLGNGDGGGGNWTNTVYRIDPKTHLITQTVSLPEGTTGGDRVGLNGGVPQIAVGAGAVWATGGGGVARLDPDSGALVATVDASATWLAAGREGVWYIEARDAGAVTPIDPRTNRTGEPTRVGNVTLSAIAVGAGSVWVAAEREGIVFRITPGASPAVRPIAVGSDININYLAYGAGAVWAASHVNGSLVRIDPHTNAVTAEMPIGEVQSLAAGAGSAWASTAGTTPPGTLPRSACTVESPAGRADVLIASDLPLQGHSYDTKTTRAMAGAIESVLAAHDYRAGKYAVGYRSCDDATVQSGTFDRRRCASNANAYAEAARVVAVIGPWNSGCAVVELPILNSAPGGPLAMISPTNSDVGLTRAGVPPPFGERGAPEIYYPTGTRHFTRLIPPDNLMGAALSARANHLGLDHVYVLHDGNPYWKAILIDPFRQTARRLGVGIAGSSRFDAGDKRLDVRALAASVERSGADGVLFASGTFGRSLELLKAVRARLGSRVPVMASSDFTAFSTKELFAEVGPRLRGVYVPAVEVPRTARPMTAAARRVARTIDAEEAGALEAAQAAEIVMDAIARSDGTRASVLAEIRAAKVTDGILGTFRFDDKGDMTPGSVPIVRFTKPAGTGAADLDGAKLDRVVRVAPSVAD
jgi:branched-chain amino acid transport system substrate-binding protein